MSKSNIKFKFNDNALRKAISNSISKSDFDISCPNCHFQFSVNGSQFGASVNCPNCKVTIELDDKKLRQDINNLKF